MPQGHQNSSRLADPKKELILVLTILLNPLVTVATGQNREVQILAKIARDVNGIP